MSIFEDPTSKDDEKPKSNRNACWNCGGSHGLRDCKEVKNYAKINAAREEFQKSKKVSSSRYFKESGLDVDVQPGLPSEKLQAALGTYTINKRAMLLNTGSPASNCAFKMVIMTIWLYLS